MYISGEPLSAIPTLVTLTGDRRPHPKVVLGVTHRDPKRIKIYSAIKKFAQGFEKLDAGQKKQLHDAFVKKFHREPFFSGDYDIMGSWFSNAFQRLTHNNPLANLVSNNPLARGISNITNKVNPFYHQATSPATHRSEVRQGRVIPPRLREKVKKDLAYMRTYAAQHHMSKHGLHNWIVKYFHSLGISGDELLGWDWKYLIPGYAVAKGYQSLYSRFGRKRGGSPRKPFTVAATPGTASPNSTATTTSDTQDTGDTQQDTEDGGQGAGDQQSVQADSSLDQAQAQAPVETLNGMDVKTIGLVAAGIVGLWFLHKKKVI